MPSAVGVVADVDAGDLVVKVAVDEADEGGDELVLAALALGLHEGYGRAARRARQANPAGVGTVNPLDLPGLLRAGFVQRALPLA